MIPLSQRAKHWVLFGTDDYDDDEQEMVRQCLIVAVVLVVPNHVKM